jgi:hypothetical protein
MPAPRTDELIVISVAVAAAAMVAVAAAVGGSMTDDTLSPGSTFSYRPAGTAAAYQTLERLGYTMRRSVEPVSAIGRDRDAAVLILANPRDPASNQDRRTIQTFVASGGIVLATGCAGATFLSSAAAGVGVPYSPAETYAARRPSPLTRDAPSITMSSGCASPALGDRYAVVYGRGSLDVVYEARIGRGHAIWWAGTTPMENATIDAPGHLELLLNAIGAPPRTIVWDEFSHGQRASLWSYLALTPAPWALAQLALVAAVAFMMFVRRRLPIRASVPMARTNPLEFVDTMAGLYARAKSGAAAAGVTRTRLRRLLLASSGIAPSASDARLADAAAGRVSMPAGELRELLEAADRYATDVSTTPAAALPLVRRMQAVATRLNGG